MNKAQLQNELVNTMHAIFAEVPEKAHEPRFAQPNYIIECLGDGWVTEDVTREQVLKIWFENLEAFKKLPHPL